MTCTPQKCVYITNHTPQPCKTLSFHAPLPNPHVSGTDCWASMMYAGNTTVATPNICRVKDRAIQKWQQQPGPKTLALSLSWVSSLVISKAIAPQRLVDSGTSVVAVQVTRKNSSNYGHKIRLIAHCQQCKKGSKESNQSEVIVWVWSTFLLRTIEGFEPFSFGNPQCVWIAYEGSRGQMFRSQGCWKRFQSQLWCWCYWTAMSRQ